MAMLSAWNPARVMNWNLYPIVASSRWKRAIVESSRFLFQLNEGEQLYASIFAESPRFIEVRFRGLAPNQIGVGSLRNGASDGRVNPGSNTEESLWGAVAYDEVAIARINVAHQKSCAVGIRSGHDHGRHTHD